MSLMNYCSNLKGGVKMELNKETLFASFESKAQFTLEENDGDVVNPSFHMGSARIFAIDSVANNVKFSQESTMNALPTLKNIPIVALYKDDEQNFGDHEIVRDVDGIRYGTYPIGMIPESAEQWIEEVQTPPSLYSTNQHFQSALFSLALLSKMSPSKIRLPLVSVSSVD